MHMVGAQLHSIISEKNKRKHMHIVLPGTVERGYFDPLFSISFCKIVMDRFFPLLNYITSILGLHIIFLTSEKNYLKLPFFSEV